MTEHPPVRLRKRSGGHGHRYEGREYTWPEDGSATEVPYAHAMDLLAIPDGDYSVEGEPAPARGVTGVAPASVRSAKDAGLDGSQEDAGEDSSEEEDREVTEPAPAAEGAVTEPAPEATVTEGSRAPESGDGSKITPKPRAGTSRGAGTTGRRAPAARRGTAAGK